jgi:hypothetical protein
MMLQRLPAVAEYAAPSRFFNRLDTLPIFVGDQDLTRIDLERGKSLIVCFETKRDQFMKYSIMQLISQKFGM